ncbi:MAG: hypothetical protein Q7I99_04390 [Acholeplasmataceae bacterium]|nr:hypothetical protein [Acholeplasmataceae bacterium]
MKKLTLFLLILSTICLFPFLTANADFGPKRTLDIEVIGINEPYFLELLEKGTLAPIEELQLNYPNENEEGQIFPSLLYTFTENGFVSSSFVRPWGYFPTKISDNNFRHSYNPPSTFKIILIFEDNTYVTSKPITTSLFNSKVTLDLTGINLDVVTSNAGTIVENLPVQTMTIDLISRIIGTIVIELIVLFLFGYAKKKSYLFVTYVNLFTQVSLTGFMFMMKYYYSPFVGEIAVLVIGEILIFGIEIILFRYYLKEKSKNRATVYALVANFFSLIASFSLMILLLNM